MPILVRPCIYPTETQVRVEKIAKKCQETFLNSAEGQYIAGLICLNGSVNLTAAKAFFEKALEMDPDHLRALHELQGLYLGHKILEKNPHFPNLIITSRSCLRIREDKAMENQ